MYEQLLNMQEIKSRIHQLPSFCTETASVFLKREDELGFGISGCKKRKYLSLIPFLQAQKYEMVYLIGGENSNNLVGLAQALREAKIPFVAYIKATKQVQKQGNAFLLQLLTQPQERVYVSSEQWHEVEKITENDLQISGKQGYIVPEGASCSASIMGLCTLMQDIERNESENNLLFDHIFIDTGTAYTAATLVAMNHFLQRKTQIHIVYIAGNEALFWQHYQKVAAFFIENDMPFTPPLPPNIQHHFPKTARAFGSINATIKQAVIDFAQTEGILTDPVYVAKTLFTAKDIIASQQLAGNILLIHSGGGTGLMGFAGLF